MATAIGTNVVTALSRRFILPKIHDNIYPSNVLLFRLLRTKKILQQGGTQIEIPLMYKKFAAGGPYSGYDLLDVSPSDTIRNAAFDWRQYYVPVTVDGLTLIRTESPEAIANFIAGYWAQAELDMAENLATGLFTDGTTNTKHLDGLKGAIDDTTVLTTYGDIDRSTNSWWKSQIDTTAYTAGGTPWSLSKMQALFGNSSAGGRHPTLLCGQQTPYNTYWNLLQANQRFPQQPGGHDEVLAQAGFTNLLFNGVPFVVDSHVPSNHVFYINEDYLYLVVSPRGDFYMEDFQTAINQDAMVAKLYFAGNLCLANCARQGKFTNVQG